MNFLENLRTGDLLEPNGSLDLKCAGSRFLSLDEECKLKKINKALPEAAARVIFYLNSVITFSVAKLGAVEERDLEESSLVKFEMKAQLISAQLSKVLNSESSELAYQEMILQKLLRNFSQELVAEFLRFQGIVSKLKMPVLESVIEKALSLVTQEVRSLSNDLQSETEMIVSKIDL